MRIIIFLIIAYGLILPAHSFAGSATTIDELTSRYDIAKCKECHDDVAADWAKTSHSNSVNSQHFSRAFRELIGNDLHKYPVTEIKRLQKVCLGCHVPQVGDASDNLIEEIAELILTAGEDRNSPAKTSAIKKLSNFKVNCRICHMLKGMKADKRKPDTIYGPGWDEDEESHQIEYGFGTVGSEFLMSSEFCANCHKGCPSDLPPSICSSLHTKSERHYNALMDNQPCQACHMKENGSVTHKFPKK